MESPKEVFCFKCSKKVISEVLTCKCGDPDMLFCSKPCYEQNMRTHKLECSAYLAKQAFRCPVLPTTNSSNPSKSGTAPMSAWNSSPASKSGTAPLPSKSGTAPLPSKSGTAPLPPRNSSPASESGTAPLPSKSGSAPLPLHDALDSPGPSAVNSRQDAAETEQVESNLMPETQSSSSFRRRDLFGRFLNKPTPRIKPVKRNKNEEIQEKERNQLASKVTKWKKGAANLMRKIQQAMPEVSQCYTLERNKFKGSKKQIIYKSHGKPLMRDLNTNEVPSNNNVSQTSGLGTDSSHMEPFSGSVDESFNVQRQRLSECLCYICKEKVGADHSQRIYCVKRDCNRGAAHIECLNISDPGRRLLSQIRCVFKCPYHRGKDEQDDVESDDLSETIQEQDTTELSDPKPVSRVRRRNDNIFKPMRLSLKLMEVLETPQQYLKANEIRALMSKYVKKLMVQNKMYIPDKNLAGVLGNQPFKLISVFKLLKQKGHLKPS